jgi:hypothetical protein
VDEANFPDRRRMAVLAGGLVLLDAWLWLFRFFNWHDGAWRAVFVLVLAVALVALIASPPVKPSARPVGAKTRKAVFALVGLGILFVCGIGGEAVIRAASTGELRLDQGQNVYRAAVLLMRGENPYGRGELLDLVAYRERAGIRAARGEGAAIPREEIAGTLDRYWLSLDPGLRDELLPPPVHAGAETEYSLYGYKYGPVLLVADAGLVTMFGSAAIPLGNLAALAAMLAAVWLALKRIGVPAVAATLAVCAVLFDYEIAEDFVFYTCSDIWPCAFGFLALYFAVSGRKYLPAVFVALAIGSKIFPGALFLPLLLIRPSRRSFALFGGVLVAILAPWLIADSRGFVLNYMLWSGLMLPDSTAWVSFVPHGLVLPIKLALALAAAVMALVAVRNYFCKIEWLWAMAVFAMLAVSLGNAFHNNYLIWFSVWATLAIAERVFGARPEQPAA